MTANKSKLASSIAVHDTPSKAIERIVDLVAGFSPGAKEQLAKTLILSCPVETRRRLAPHFSPKALRRASAAEQGELLARLAVGRCGTATAIATAVYDEIERYRASTWLFERNRPAPSDPRRALLHALLALTEAAVPSVRTMRRLFAPVATRGPLAGHGRV